MTQSKKKETPKYGLEPTKQPEKEVKQEKIKKAPIQEASAVHIDEFIEAIRPIEDLNDGKAQGFKAFMSGNHYLPELNDFVPYLETYIGKDVK